MDSVRTTSFSGNLGIKRERTVERHYILYKHLHESKSLKKN